MLLLKPYKFFLLSVGFLLTPLLAAGADLKFEQESWTINPQVLNVEKYFVRNDFLLKDHIKQSYKTQPYHTTTLGIDKATADTLLETVKEINQETKAPKLTIENDRATEFEPGQNGQALDVYQTAKLITANNNSITLPVFITKPTTSLADTNNLGITELLAVGESDFTGSPRNRRVNIDVGAKRYQGLILKPGEEFSFNKILGDVDAEHGFLPELVIKKSGVVPEFGGGLCQVSSTAFRAAMNAGLPIVERRNHSFAVKYYAPQGTDATIYPGVTDFRFTNDLKSHLLIRVRNEDSKLYYEFYGTKDDRKITFDGPYQYDKNANGSMKAIWTRWVEKDGDKKEQVFRSTYQPPALFQQTTQASTPNPTSNPTTPPTTETPTTPAPQDPATPTT